MAVPREILQHLGVADLLGRLLPDEEVTVALHDLEQGVVPVVEAVAQGLDLVEQVVVLQDEPPAVPQDRREGVGQAPPVHAVVCHPFPFRRSGRRGGGTRRPRP